MQFKPEDSQCAPPRKRRKLNSYCVVNQNYSQEHRPFELEPSLGSNNTTNKQSQISKSEKSSKEDIVIDNDQEVGDIELHKPESIKQKHISSYKVESSICDTFLKSACARACECFSS